MSAARSAAASGEAGSMLSVLRDRTFGSFFATNSLSNVGNWFQNVAAGIVVYNLTGSNTAVGAVSIVQFAATMVLTPWMGAVTDRVNRRKMLLVGQSIACAGAVALAALVFIVGVDGLPGPWPIYAATAVIGVGAAVILPSLQAIVPALVRKQDLDRAITLNSMTFNIARGVGPIAAGATVAAFGAEWAFGINALTFLPLLLVLIWLDPRGSVEPQADVVESIPASVKDGLQWMKQRPGVLAVIAATLIVGWTSDPFSTLMPALAEDLGGGDATVGLLVGCFGFGAAALAPFSDNIRDLVGRSRIIPAGLVGVAVGLIVMALAPTTVVALAGAAISGAGFLLGVTGTNSELQKVLPEEVRGRVMAWWSVAFLGCRPVAAVVDGAIADATDERIALGVAAAIALLAGGYFAVTGLRTAPVE